MKKFLLWFFPLLAILVCVGLTVFNYTQTKDSIDYLKSFKPAAAVVSEKRLILDSNGKYDITFTYEVDGEQYSHTVCTRQPVSNTYRRRIFGGSVYHQGEHTTVWYDPADPTIMRGGKPSPWLNILFPMFFALPLAFISFVIMLRLLYVKKDRKKAKDSHHRDRDYDDDDDDD